MQVAMRQLWHSQNFLKDQPLVAALLKKTNICSNDLVLEIGPGTGVITGQLCKRAKYVVAVEKDHELYSKLQIILGLKPLNHLTMSQFDNLRIKKSDIMSYALPTCDYKVFANIPFNYTADIVRKLLFDKHSPVDAYLFMQKEAAYRFVGQPNTTLMSLKIAPLYSTEIIHQFKCTDFLPVPSVDVVLVHFKKRDPPLLASLELQKFLNFVEFSFKQSSFKKLMGKLFTRTQRKRLEQELKFNVQGDRGDLSFYQWQKLFQFFQSHASEVKHFALIDND